MLSDNMGASKDAMDEEGNAAADLGLVARIRESFDSLNSDVTCVASIVLALRSFHGTPSATIWSPTICAVTRKA